MELGEAVTPMKRQKTSVNIACVTCRRRKVKCSGRRPTCDSCLQRSTECIYNADRSRYQTLLQRFNEARLEIEALKASHSCRPEGLEATEAAPIFDSRSDAKHQISESFGERTLTCGNCSSAEEHNASHQRDGCFNRLVERISTTAHVEVLSMVRPPGWRALCDQFRKIYSADLPFVHHPTILESVAAGQTSTTVHNLNGSTTDLTGMPLDSVIVVLSFLALTLRHCEIDFGWHKLREGKAHNNFEQSKNCARLSLLYLRNHSSTERDVTIESVQARLMLACYQWSTCHCTSARYLLSEANSLLQEVHSIRSSYMRRRQKSVSVAMSFEAELLGVEVVQDDWHDWRPSADLEDETYKRTSWSLHLLDLRFSLGTSRAPLVPSCSAMDLPMLASENSFQCNSSSHEPTTSQHGSTKQSIDANNGHPQQLTSTHIQLSSRTNCWWSSSIGDDSELGPDSRSVPLNYYMSGLSLLREITLHTSSSDRRFTTYPPWSPSCPWNSLLRRSLAIDKAMLGRLQLNEVNTYAHLGQTTASHFVNMHVARLLCRIFIHWELFPFLPLRCCEPSGPLRQGDCFESGDAPRGFWKSGARELFNAAKAILDLEISCQRSTSLTTNAFTAYGVFVAKFFETYAAHFPWMDPDDRMRTHSSLSGGNRTSRPPRGPAFQADQNPSGVLCASEIVRCTFAWIDTLETISRYFGMFKCDFQANISMSAPISMSDRRNPGHGTLCLRDGGYGGGFGEYELFQQRLFNFGDQQ